MSLLSIFKKGVFGYSSKKEAESNSQTNQKPVKSIYKKSKKSKIYLIKNHLIENGTIDIWTALEKYGTTRLSDIILKLRKEGMNITLVPYSEVDESNRKYTTYKLNQ
jgi:hypothetical protein